MTHRSTRLLSVGSLARVEGEGAMHVQVRDGEVESVRLSIYEPPRFFEALLRGRRYDEPVDITARICGICPVAYQMTACQAIEDACGVTVDGQLAALRRLLYCGEWIESHSLHIYLLHAPDFLGLPDALALARTDRELVERGLRLKQAGNQIMEVLGGRAVHPVNVRLGGFHRLPDRSELDRLAALLRTARRDAEETVAWTAELDYPDLHVQHALLALRPPDSYPLDSGTPTLHSGYPSAVAPLTAFLVAEFERHVVEAQAPHSTALQATVDGRHYLTGPLARWRIAAELLPAELRQMAALAGVGGTCDNPFRSIAVRAIEVLWAVREAQRLLEEYESPPRPAVPVPPRAGIGHAATEAPRGLLYHRYELGSDGTIVSADIVPPTSQNQAAIEADLRDFVQQRLHLEDTELTRQCEQAIRNYDPCISCATHFLDLTVEGR
ncbi:Ni/Fe hydrogenase subunit alpha [Streptacidiphilus pinicola]|uniref:Ni/Fe hydrogenase subunit alpha n=1 Tax=Streptacidiphilus pinicola TaxID=2219663 RepID=A0A2X0IT88_9ACTN|nr:Ni/Fe hydrogenase subunit alpha [Streptacidiphilus pinicola]RAG86813.1 Ni/Fe hydrogenase subunit alpha [Streptacidiphilus pinicola]